MRRCANCQYDNVDDALACARCGQALPREAAPAAPRSDMPAWLSSSLQAGAAASSDTEGASPTAGPTSSNGALAAAAALPVQVRRSRVPVLSVDAGHTGLSSTLTDAGVTADARQAGTPLKRTKARKASSSGRGRLLVLLIVLLIAAVVIFGLALRHAF